MVLNVERALTKHTTGEEEDEEPDVSIDAFHSVNALGVPGGRRKQSLVKMELMCIVHCAPQSKTTSLSHHVRLPIMLYLIFTLSKMDYRTCNHMNTRKSYPPQAQEHSRGKS